MEIKIRKNYLRLPYDSIANGALPPRLTSFLQLLMDRRGLGPRNDVLTTCKAITLRGGQRIIAVFFSL